MDVCEAAQEDIRIIGVCFELLDAAQCEYAGMTMGDSFKRKRMFDQLKLVREHVDMLERRHDLWEGVNPDGV